MRKSSYPVRSASTRVRKTDKDSPGITSPTLKRSFEVEETDSTTHPAPLTRRATAPLRSSSSASSQRGYEISSRNSEYPSSRSSESSSLRSPKIGLRRVEVSGGRNPDSASSRRTEISIEVSSKQIDNSPSAGIARFGLKRPEVSLSSRCNPQDNNSNSTSSTTNRRADLSFTRFQEPSAPPPPPRRMDSALSSPSSPKISESCYKRPDPLIPNPGAGCPDKPEMSTSKTPDELTLSATPDNSYPTGRISPLSSLSEHRVERGLSLVTELASSDLDLPDISSSFSHRVMSDTGMSDAMMSLQVGSLYGEKTAGTFFGDKPASSFYGEKPGGGLYGERSSANLYGEKPGGSMYGEKTIGNLYGEKSSGNLYGDKTVGNSYGPRPVGNSYGEKSTDSPLDFNYVGIDAILEQMRRKAMKQGFEFNIMVVGQSGLGKSTLMNTLFKTKVSRKSMVAATNYVEKIPKTVEIKSVSHDIEEKGVRMKLTVIDTPGFGDQINNENCWQPIMKFINDQYEAYLQEEININRKKRIPDSRVHCCIYFIPPTGHCLRPLDLEFMQHLSKVVNIVPVIAKADTLTLEERHFFKKKIRDDLISHGIDIYPQKEFDEDAEDRMINETIREMIPFAVVGSDLEYQVNGKRLLGRKTKWGTIEVENIEHCEFAYLRDLLIRTHMQNIKDITSSIHYEVYRVKRLNESNMIMSKSDIIPGRRPTAKEM